MAQVFKVWAKREPALARSLPIKQALSLQSAGRHFGQQPSTFQGILMNRKPSALRQYAVALLAAAATCSAVAQSNQSANSNSDITPVGPSEVGATSGASGSTHMGMGYGSGGSGTRSRGMYDNSGNNFSLLPYTRKGYVGISAGKSNYDNPCGTGGFSCSDPDAALRLYTGGMFNDYIGLEAAYLHMGRADRGGGRTQAQGLNLSVVGKLPLGMFNVFAKGGTTYGRTKVSANALSGLPTGNDSGWGPSYGAGVGYDITPTSGLVLEWERHDFHYSGAGKENATNTSIGYVHRF
jgi:OmpA-OmpF porin, OOP family